MLFNKKAYITNLRLTQNGRILPLKYDVKPKGNKKATMSEEYADRLQSNLIRLILQRIESKIQGNVAYWKLDESHNISQIDKTYYVYTGRTFDENSKVGKILVQKALDTKFQSTKSPWKNVNYRMMKEVGFIIKTQYAVDRIGEDNIKNISFDVYMTVPGRLEPIEVDGKTLRFGVNDVQSVTNLYICSNMKSLLQYLDK